MKYNKITISLLIVGILMFQLISLTTAEEPPGDRERTKYTVYGYVEDIDTEDELSNALVCI